MKKRFLCALMALIMLVSLVPVTALTASAASLTTSEDAISVIKDLEGYRSKCYKDGSQYSIGYGTKCDEKHTSETDVHTITENDANTALREELTAVEKAVNNFATANSLSLTQGKFDALVSFSYNCGTAWMNGSGTFKKAVVNGTTGNDFLYAICLWCNDSTGVSNGLLNRRLIEANMYLNGDYSGAGNYTYVKYNGNGGTATDKVQGYSTSSAVAIKASATKNGQTFMGWYTAKEGGEWVRSLTSTVKGKTLYAHWQDAKEPAHSDVSYKMAASSFTSLQPLSKPSADGTAHGTKLNASDTVSIVQDYVDANGAHWCRVSGSGWLKVGTLVIEEEKETSKPTNVVVTVTNTYINVRKKASASSAKVGTVNYGDKLTITKVEKASNGALWGQFEDGWVALMYTDYNGTKEEEKNETVEEGVIATAVVSCSSYVNVRKGAGVDKKLVSTLANGTKVDLYEITTVKGHKWGRVSNGWFCLDYATVTMIKDDASEDKKEENKVSEDAIAAGTVVCSTVVNVRKGAGVDKKLVGTLANGTEVEIYEITKVKGHEWGRIGEEKWVCLDYVDVTVYAKGEIPEENEEETTTTAALFTGTVAANVNIREEADAASEKVGTYAKGDAVSITKVVPGTKADGTTVAVWGQTDKGWICMTGNITLTPVKYTVISNTLNVREGAGTTYDPVDKLSKGTVVSISDLTYVGENLWGYSDVFGGWMNITSTYMERTTSTSGSSNNSSSSDNSSSNNSTTTTPTGYVGTAIVNGVQLNVRNGAGMNYTQVATLASGAEVKIYEIVVSNGAAWGRTDTGWIALTYVLFTSTGENYNATIVNTYIGVNVRSSVGTAATLLTKIMVNGRVQILEQKKHNGQNWGRTAAGWVCMDYVLLDSNAGANMDDILNGTGSAGTGSNGSTGSTGSTSTEATALSSYSGTTKEATDIYKAAGSEETVGVTLGANEAITVYELATFTAEDKTESYWARVDEGWILASNVTLKDIEQTYTITNDTLNVRKGPGTTYDKVGKLEKGDVVLVTEVAIFNATVWGYVEDEGGWISTSSKYVTLGKVDLAEKDNTTTGTTTGNTTTGTTTGNTNTGATGGVLYTGTVYGTSDGLRIRKTASTSSTELGKLKNGTTVKIYEVAVAEYMAWGRCDSGWICLTYVNLDPSSSDVVDTRIIWTEGLSIRAQASVASDLVGNYAKCTIVDILEVNGDWGRTADGWINLNYVLP